MTKVIGVLIVAVFLACLAYWIGFSAAQRQDVTRYYIYPLDITSKRSGEAIAECSKLGGLAGWLTRINGRGDYIGPSEVYCVVEVKRGR